MFFTKVGNTAHNAKSVESLVFPFYVNKPGTREKLIEEKVFWPINSKENSIVLKEFIDVESPFEAWKGKEAFTEHCSTFSLNCDNSCWIICFTRNKILYWLGNQGVVCFIAFWAPKMLLNIFFFSLIPGFDGSGDCYSCLI